MRGTMRRNMRGLAAVMLVLVSAGMGVGVVAQEAAEVPSRSGEVRRSEDLAREVGELRELVVALQRSIQEIAESIASRSGWNAMATVTQSAPPYTYYGAPISGWAVNLGTREEAEGAAAENCDAPGCRTEGVTYAFEGTNTCGFLGAQLNLFDASAIAFSYADIPPGALEQQGAWAREKVNELITTIVSQIRARGLVDFGASPPQTRANEAEIGVRHVCNRQGEPYVLSQDYSLGQRVVEWKRLGADDELPNTPR